MLQHAAAGLAHDGERLGQQVVERLALASAARNSAVLRAELFVGERLDAGFERVDCGDARPQPLQFAVVLGADDLGEELTKHVRDDTNAWRIPSNHTRDGRRSSRNARVGAARGQSPSVWRGA